MIARSNFHFFFFQYFFLFLLFTAGKRGAHVGSTEHGSGFWSIVGDFGSDL
jgi:hypothetical protein